MRIVYYLFFIALCSAFSHASIVVVVPKSVPIEHVSLAEIQHLFMGKTSTIQGIKLEPKDNDHDIAYKEFCEDVLGKNTQQMKSYWARMIFTGQKKPPQIITPEELLSVILATSVITYVSKENLPSGWKIIYEPKK
jgi:hypothetical protein